MPVENKLKIEDYTMYDFIIMSPEDAGKVLLDECMKESPDMELINNILEFSMVDVNHQEDGCTELMWASYEGHTEIVKLLLERPETDVNLQNHWGNTALMFASYEGYTEIVKMLLERPKIDVNLQNSDGNTALIKASKWGHTEIVRMLLNKKGIKPLLKNKKGKTFLDVMDKKLMKEIVVSLGSIATKKLKTG